MTVERLHFAPGAMAYHSMLAAEHVARYVFAAALCAGRRVLDVACGEGYGSAMLAAAGAARVVGVDISEEAVSLARARFAGDRLEFKAGDAASLATILSEEAPFDLIVSFETIEHLADPRPFLEGLRAVLAPGGGIVISAPNEGDTGPASANPFHLQTYTLESFRETTERVLGPADGLWLGSPMQGYGILPASSPLCGTDHEGLDAMLAGEPAGASHLLPAQREQRLDPRRASFFMACWGAQGAATLAAAPIAFEAWVEIPRAAEWLRAENARLLREVAAARAGAMPPQHEVTELIADCQRAALLDAERLQAARQGLAAARADLARTVAERDALRTLAAERDALRMAAAACRGELAAIHGSRSWRLLQAYTRLYQAPLIGPPLRSLRRLAGRTLRAIRSR